MWRSEKPSFTAFKIISLSCFIVPASPWMACPYSYSLQYWWSREKFHIVTMNLFHGLITHWYHKMLKWIQHDETGNSRLSTTSSSNDKSISKSVSIETMLTSLLWEEIVNGYSIFVTKLFDLNTITIPFWFWFLFWWTIWKWRNWISQFTTLWNKCVIIEF